MTKTVAMLALALTLAGCASGAPKMWVGKNAQGNEILTARCIPQQSPSECSAMQTVTITKVATDEEFWIFEAQVELRANIGFSYGRVPRHFASIGNQERCEVARAEVTATATPTGPCQGPFYFRRDKA